MRRKPDPVLEELKAMRELLELPEIKAALVLRPGDSVVFELSSWPSDEIVSQLREKAQAQLGVPVLLVYGATVTGIREVPGDS